MRIEKGSFREKHSSEAILDPVIWDDVRKKVISGTITCGEAEDIARRLSKSMKEVGTVLDLTETQIVKCQLGLFGYYPHQRIITPAQKIDSRVEKAIRARLVNGRLPCYEAWELAKTFTLPRIDISSVCEAIDVKIGPCQLGAF